MAEKVKQAIAQTIERSAKEVRLARKAPKIVDLPRPRARPGENFVASCCLLCERAFHPSTDAAWNWRKTKH